jgi:hypothetical protein
MGADASPTSELETAKAAAEQRERGALHQRLPRRQLHHARLAVHNPAKRRAA